MSDLYHDHIATAQRICDDKERGWEVTDATCLTCPCGHVIDWEGECPDGCVSPIRSGGFISRPRPVPDHHRRRHGVSGYWRHTPKGKIHIYPYQNSPQAACSKSRATYEGERWGWPRREYLPDMASLCRACVEAEKRVLKDMKTYLQSRVKDVE